MLEGRPPADHALRRLEGGPLPPAAAGRAWGPPGPVPEPDGLPVERLACMVGSLTAVGKSMGPRPAASDPKSSELTMSGDHLRGRDLPKQRWKGSAILHEDDAGPAGDVEAGVVGGPQGDAALSALVATSGRQRRQWGERGMASALNIMQFMRWGGRPLLHPQVREGQGRRPFGPVLSLDEVLIERAAGAVGGELPRAVPELTGRLLEQPNPLQGRRACARRPRQRRR